MKNYFKITTFAFLFFGVSATAQIVPLQPPTKIDVGASGAAKYALNRLGLNKTQIKTLANLEGPATGWGRMRHGIQTHAITPSDLPEIEGYFYRSSYVTLNPGGVAPLHSHVERPAYLQVISGSVVQHRSDGRSFIMGPGDYTFSSDGISHWWNNIGDTPMTLWIVELCSAAHGCDKVIDGGATILTGSAPSQEHNTHAKTDLIMEIDLAGEFPNASSIQNQQLRLRKIEIPSNQSSDFDSTINHGRPSYVRVAEGTLTITNNDGAQRFEANSVILITEKTTQATWSNQGSENIILYAVDIFDAQ